MSTETLIDTPFLLVDLDAMEFNIDSVVSTCREAKIAWRPHAKCHKSGAIAKKLVQAGALGVTCAKLSEAEVIGRAGVRDLLIANLVVGQGKLERLARLCDFADPIVCVDSIAQAEPMAAMMESHGKAIRVIIEVDIGLSRVGVPPGAPTLDLAKQLVNLKGLNFSGIMGYEGHLLTIPNPEDKRRSIANALDELVATRDALVAEQVPCPIVSCGGTGSYQISAYHPGITEVQAGGAIFMDQFYRNVCKVETLKHSLHVIATVVSRPTADRAIIDAGRKTFNQDHEPARVLGHDGVTVESLSAEHGTLHLPDGCDLPIGTRLKIIPGYNDMTTVLHNQIHGFRGDELEVIWPLEARGLLS